MGATSVKRLARLGMVPSVPGMYALDMNSAEDKIVNNTREVRAGRSMQSFNRPYAICILSRSFWHLFPPFACAAIPFPRCMYQAYCATALHYMLCCGLVMPLLGLWLCRLWRSGCWVVHSAAPFCPCGAPP